MILASQRMHKHSNDVAILVAWPEAVRGYPTTAAIVFNLAGQPSGCVSLGFCANCRFRDFCGKESPSVAHMFTSLSSTHPELLI